MPLAAPIGSGLGICNPYSIAIIKERAKVPVIVDAGVGHRRRMRRSRWNSGVDALLMNTGIAAARDPGRDGARDELATQAGRLAFLAGRMEKKLYANASSPTSGLIATRRESGS